MNRSFLLVLGAALCCLSSIQRTAHAQDAPANYYHVSQVTTGCQNPAAVRILADPAQTDTADPKRIKAIRTSGRCVTITPRSKWAFLWRENDVAMMSYSGTIGPPGSYYLRVEDLLDADGHHPGENTQTNSPEASLQAPEPNTPAALPNIAAPASAPETVANSASAPPPPDPPALPTMPERSADALIASTASRPAPVDVMPLEPLPGKSAQMPARVWMPAVSLAVLVAALGGFALLRRRQGKPANRTHAFEIALSEIQTQALALRQAKSDSLQPDRYGTTHLDGWEREKALFVNSRIFTRLRDAGYADALPALLPVIDTEIERQANSQVDPGAAAPDTDPELSTYATRCESLLRNAGWSTEPTPAEAGKGIGILAERGGRKLLLQCTGKSAPVGVDAVQRVFASCAQRHADVAAIVTRASFTRAAQQLASANGVHALHEDGLLRLIQ